MGGKVADKPELKDETPDQSIIREIKEEANIIPLTLVHQADIFYDHRSDANKDSEMMKVYRSDRYHGNESENPDEFHLIWINID